MVGVAPKDIPGIGILVVDPPALLLQPGAHPESQVAGNDRRAIGDPYFIARLAALGVAVLDLRVTACLLQIGLRGDVADGTAHGTRTEQRALRSPQYFD